MGMVGMVEKGRHYHYTELGVRYVQKASVAFAETWHRRIGP